jgi:hypothetical protein
VTDVKVGPFERNRIVGDDGKNEQTSGLIEYHIPEPSKFLENLAQK